MSLVGVEGGFWAGEGSDFVLGAATGGVVLAGDTTTFFFSLPAIRGSLGASVGGVNIVSDFKSLFNNNNKNYSLFSKI